MDPARRMSVALWPRFVAVGIINAAFGYGVYVFMLGIGLGYATASALATVIGVLFNFKTIGALVFGSRDSRLMFRFFAVYAAVYGVNLLGLRLLVQGGVGADTAGLVTLCPAAVLAYVLNKAFVFRVPT